jgi:hypothetical protein
MIIIKDLSVARELSHEERAAERGGFLGFVRKAAADPVPYLSYDFTEVFIAGY